MWPKVQCDGNLSKLKRLRKTLGQNGANFHMFSQCLLIVPSNLMNYISNEK